MPIILNKEGLATSELRKNGLEILEAGLLAVQTEKILREKVKLENGVLNVGGESFNLQSFNRIIFVGIGKCALDGARAMQDILGDRLTAGAVIDLRRASEALDVISRGKIKYYQGTHPLPSPQNVEATREILEMVKELAEDDLVICLISGGGSALFELPTVPLEMIIQTTRDMTARGADIYELNRVRKEMSQVKGGKFAESCAPAKVVSLIFSDVLGNDLSVIASGPTVSAKSDVKNILLCSNRDALLAMKDKAEELGYGTEIETETFSGNAKEIGEKLALRELGPKTCILLGGESTVKIPAHPGIGGRNQELALSALMNVPEDALLISASSDGWDNTDHAGAIADAELFEKAKSLGLDPEIFLERSDSYNFFEKCGGAISTGKLGSNVSDLVIMITNGK